MSSSNHNRFWAAVTIFLVVLIVSGGILVWSEYEPEQPLEISIAQPEGWQGKVLIGGHVAKPGFYPLKAADSIDSLLRAAGGADSSANLTGLELYIPGVGEGQGPQKVDINRADAFLLEALPGIGATLANRIIDYRQKNGLFSNIDELLKVPGIGATVYLRIKALITVADR